MIFRINNHDYTTYLEDGGLQRTRTDLDDEAAGRDMLGYMHRSKIATKIQLQATFRNLTTSEISPLLNDIEAQTMSVYYTDPKAGTEITKTMYCNSNPVICMRKYGNEEKWQSFSVTLVEV